MMFVFRHLPENQDSAVGDLPLVLLATVSEARALTEEVEKSNHTTSFWPVWPLYCCLLPGRIDETDDFDLVVKGPVIPERTPCLRSFGLTLSVASGVVDNERKYTFSRTLE